MSVRPNSKLLASETKLYSEVMKEAVMRPTMGNGISYPARSGVCGTGLFAVEAAVRRKKN